MSMTRHESILSRLSKGDKQILKNTSHEANILERRWARRFRDYFKEIDIAAANHLEAFETMEGFQFDILPLLLQHHFEVMKTAIVRAEGEKELRTGKAQMGKKTMPRSLRELFALYERWRVRKQLPKRSQETAQKIKETYIKKVQSVWDRQGEDFRSGKVFDKGKAIRTIETHTKMPRARSAMTIQTETTAYYNQGRRAVYDGMKEVSHYLFVAIRDHRTTKWCRDYHKGGRHGLVYDKDTDVLDRETPPIHWNCRSELLPLTEFNPVHKKLIDDKSLRRNNRNPEPLPKGWVKR